ncbi:hypothetical protein P154DRAFT_57944 [Amniculicola lignicola CBS 123094]|uniref:Uncharacterized protein n=1 Tax=Amniculicola lignicola CBS 123094 TaxID=1392246 RepID=A0A6A5VWG2_9PLEO|nr:hypothetical protein P154DRAFT_57944 [Amniculicola lignicola CBS 123094]
MKHDIGQASAHWRFRTDCTNVTYLSSSHRYFSPLSSAVIRLMLATLMLILNLLVQDLCWTIAQRGEGSVNASAQHGMRGGEGIGRTSDCHDSNPITKK